MKLTPMVDVWIWVIVAVMFLVCGVIDAHIGLMLGAVPPFFIAWQYFNIHKRMERGRAQEMYG